MDIVTKMANKFDSDKLALKVVEECLELSEVLTKFVTKGEGMKPPLYKIVEEMGDVLFRMQILITHLGVDGSVKLRIEEKAKQIENWFAEKYETEKS